MIDVCKKIVDSRVFASCNLLIIDQKHPRILNTTENEVTEQLPRRRTAQSGANSPLTLPKPPATHPASLPRPKTVPMALLETKCEASRCKFHLLHSGILETEEEGPEFVAKTEWRKPELDATEEGVGANPEEVNMMETQFFLSHSHSSYMDSLSRERALRLSAIARKKLSTSLSPKPSYDLRQLHRTIGRSFPTAEQC